MARRDALRRVAWFVALWLAGVGAVGLLALVIRTVLMPG